MSHADKEIYEFADFRLDVEERLLLKNGTRVQLRGRAFEILCLLVRENHHLVSKDKLLEKVWAGAIVEENNLDKNISALRQALGEQRGQGEQKFIETVRGSGYRFVAEVRRVAAVEAAKDEAVSESRVSGAENAQNDVSLNNAAAPNRHVSASASQTGKVIALARWRRVKPEQESQIEFAAPETIADEQTAAAIFETPLGEPARAAQTSAVVESEKPITESTIEKSAHKSKTRLTLMAALSLIALAGISFAVYKFANPAPLRFEAKKMTRLTASGKVKVAVISPDGKLIAYSQEEHDGQQSLRVKHIGSDSDVQIAAPAKIDYQGLNISPDGNHLYYTNEKGTLYKMPVLGGASKKIADGLYTALNNSEIGISPDGRQIAFARRFEKDASALFVADSDGGNEKAFASFEQPSRLNPYAAWSPDGKTIACAILTAAARQNILAVNVADKTSALVSPNGWATLNQIAWLTDSKSLLAGVGGPSPRQVWQVSYPGGEERQITDDTNDYRGFSLTSDGRFLATIKAERVAHIWAMRSNDATRARQLTTGFEKFDGSYGLVWMPDGKIFYHSSPSGINSIWAIEADGGNAKQLAKWGIGFSAISPDGRFIVSQKGSRATGDIGIYRTDVSDGSEKQLTKGVDVWETFSPNGEWVVYTHYGGRVGLWKVPIEGGEATQILDENAICPAVSPDGKTIAFVWRRAGQPHRIALVGFDGGEITKTFDVKLTKLPFTDKQNLQWTPDGRAINYIAVSDGVSNIWQQPVDGSPPVQVTDFKDGRIFNFAFSADGSQLALSRGTFNSDVVLIENAR